MALEEIRSERTKKIRILHEKGLIPYPAESARSHLIGEVLKKFASLRKRKKRVAITGRITAKREHGGSSFMDLRDASGKIQIYFKKNVLKEAHNLALEIIDIGDFIETSGTLFKTRRKEKTIEVLRWKMLVKSLRPLPEKWHGLQDVEERFRKRYLDLLINEGVRERFFLRSKIVSTIRAFFDTNGFYEVETPILQPIPGGALARPFKTHHNALNVDFYLRIAPELYLKKLLVGGLEKIYEIGKVFRNEGIDATHNPEFTMLECYQAYSNEENLIKFTESLITSLLKKVFGKKTEIEYGDQKINFRRPFAKITFKDLLRKYTHVSNYDKESREMISTMAKELGLMVGPENSKGKIADEIYKKICRPHLIQPTFVTNHPLEISPLAKRYPENPSETKRIQLIVGGIEIANGFSELNDPQEQRSRFEKQEKTRLEGEEEAHRIDEEYLEALEYGMPPAAGLGIGIDRLVMLLTDTKNIREIVLFPTLRPK